MMFKSSQFFVLLSLVLSSWALSVQHDRNQAVFQPPSAGSYKPPRGVLNKFYVAEEEREEVIRVAVEYNLDIWHATPTEVHIYTHEGDEIPPSLLNYAPQHIAIEAPIPSSYPSSSSRPTSSSSSGTANWNLPSFQNTTYHSTYHPLWEIDEFLAQLAEVFPGKVTVREIGHSAEGREMRAVSISSTPREKGLRYDGEEGWEVVEAVEVGEGVQEEGDEKDKDEDKKKKKSKKEKNNKKKKDKKNKNKNRPPPAEKSKLGFVVVGAQHAREWIATATALHFAHALTSNTSEPHSLGGLLDVYDFHIIPVPNPDGYDYTWEYDRFWYKNRQIIGPKAKCIGLDMNRNWGYKWKPDGDGNGMLQPALNASSTADAGFSAKPKPADPCSHWYPGLRAFEAPEANNIANFVNTLPDVVAFVDLRSYGQMLSSPYSYSCKRMPKDAEDQIEAALGATQALKKAYGTAFKTGSVCQNLYRAPGNIVDWMYARAGIKYSYVAHLRDTGTYGFSLPEKWIRPVGEETGNMIGYIAQFIAKQLGRSI